MFTFTSDDVQEPTGDILVRGCGSAGVAVEAALQDVAGGLLHSPSLAFVVCDPDTRQSVASATWLARTLQEQEIFTVGVALGPCDESFSDAVDLLIRIPGDDAAEVLRPLVGATAGRSLLPFETTDLCWLFQQGGEVIADRRSGITTMAELGAAIDGSIEALRCRGALTDDSDWFLYVLHHGPAFEVGKSASIATAGLAEARPPLVLVGTFRDMQYGEGAQLISLARVCIGE